MPIYEFECSGCGGKFSELFGRPCKSPKTKCPDCGSKKVKRVFSTFGMGRGKGGDRGGGTSAGGCGSCRASSCASCGK